MMTFDLEDECTRSVGDKAASYWRPEEGESVVLSVSEMSVAGLVSESIFIVNCSNLDSQLEHSADASSDGWSSLSSLSTGVTPQ